MVTIVWLAHNESWLSPLPHLTQSPSRALLPSVTYWRRYLAPIIHELTQGNIFVAEEKLWIPGFSWIFKGNPFLSWLMSMKNQHNGTSLLLESWLNKMCTDWCRKCETFPFFSQGFRDFWQKTTALLSVRPELFEFIGRRVRAGSVVGKLKIIFKWELDDAAMDVWTPENWSERSPREAFTIWVQLSQTP